jgi:hypothetical protein
MGIVSNITGGNNDRIEIRSQWEGNGQPFKTFKAKTETLNIKHQATLFHQRSLAGDTLIWDNPVYGIWDSQDWGDTVVGGSPDWVLMRVAAPNNVFEEEFVSEYFINTSSTTAQIIGGILTF